MRLHGQTVMPVNQVQPILKFTGRLASIGKSEINSQGLAKTHSTTPPPARSGKSQRCNCCHSSRESPLVISGRGARNASESLLRFLDAVDALYLDTQESRGLIPADHASVAGAVRGAAMAQADLVITLGRKLDYQLGFGSPAAFPNARFLRIADNASELIDNRRGSPEISC